MRRAEHHRIRTRLIAMKCHGGRGEWPDRLWSVAIRARTQDRLDSGKPARRHALVLHVTSSGPGGWLANAVSLLGGVSLSSP